jgi:cytochrome c biogenesis protein
MAAKGKKGIFARIWDLFISVRLTIVLLILLSAVCVIGTLIPQNESPMHYMQLYSASTYKLFAAAGFFDLFHTWWFITIMIVFTLNLVTCSLNRLPRVWRLIFHGATILDEKLLQGLSLVKKFNLKKFTAQHEEQMAHTIGGYLKKPALVKKPGEWNFFAESGHYTRLGFYLTHVGLVTIILGAMGGNLGFQGYMQITEGQTSNVIQLKKTNEIKNLDFAIRCDKFDVTYYAGSPRPKDYKSVLTVIDNNKEVLQKTIEVNDPLIYRGIFFYQSSYGAAPDGTGKALIRLVQKDGGKQHDLNVTVGSTTPVPGTPYVVRANEFLPDFTMGNDGKPLSRSEQLNNPAINLTILKDGKENFSTWVFAKFPDFHGTGERPFDMQLVNFQPKYYTGLQATQDPGVWVVWLGCALLVVGTYVAFFTSHRRIWLRVEEKDGEFKAVLGGSTNKNHVAFAKEFETLFKNLKS